MRLLAQALDEGRHVVDLQHLHAPLHAARDGLVLVAAEVVAGAGAQQRRDLRQVVGRLAADAIGALAPAHGVEMAEVVVELGGDRLDRQHEVDHPGAHRAAHHAVVFGTFLGDGQAAAFLDRAQADGTVAACAGEDHAGAGLAARHGQGLEEGVDRRALTAALDRRAEMQLAIGQGQRGVGRNDIDAVSLDDHAVGGLYDRDAGGPAEDVRQDTGVRRVEVLDDHEGHAAIGPQMRQQGFQGTDAASRRADADHG